MSNRPHIDDLFRKELGGMQHEASEALWQKLDAQLQPERDAYNRKDKKRRAVWFILPLALLLGGGTIWYFSGKSSSGKKEAIAANAEQPLNTTKSTPAAPANTANNAQPGNTNNTISTENNQPVIQSAPENNGVLKPVATEQPTVVPVNRVTVNNSRNNSRIGINEPAVPGIVTATVAKLNEKASKNNTTARRGRNSKKAEPAEEIKIVEITEAQPVDVGTTTVEGVKDEDKAVVTQPSEEEKINVIPPVETVSEPVKKTDTQPEVKTAKAKSNNKAVTGKTAISVVAGTNLSSPFRKPGVFGGLMLTKNIGDKHIFAGLKMSDNRLEHQLISSEKQNQPAPQTDAVIEKLTILQLPFGYEFKLNGKGKPATTFLEVGFEPAYITGLRTLYYDDNGIPGGPVTVVTNSPLLSKAVNRFNLSFIAGVRKQITPRIGISLSGGYSLIDITDKQYYNRTSTNNNLKYIQAGLLFRLNK